MRPGKFESQHAFLGRNRLEAEIRDWSCLGYHGVRLPLGAGTSENLQAWRASWKEWASAVALALAEGMVPTKLKGPCRFPRSCSGLRLVGMTLQGRSGQSWG